MDIGFHLTGMGDYGVLNLVFCMASSEGVIEVSTAAVRIDSMSHGGAYRNVDFGEATPLMPLSPIRADEELYENAWSPLSPIEVDEGVQINKDGPSHHDASFVDVSLVTDFRNTSDGYNVEERLQGIELV